MGITKIFIKQFCLVVLCDKLFEDEYIRNIDTFKKIQKKKRQMIKKKIITKKTVFES